MNLPDIYVIEIGAAYLAVEIEGGAAVATFENERDAALENVPGGRVKKLRPCDATALVMRCREDGLDVVRFGADGRRYVAKAANPRPRSEWGREALS